MFDHHWAGDYASPASSACPHGFRTDRSALADKDGPASTDNERQARVGRSGVRHGGTRIRDVVNKLFWIERQASRKCRAGFLASPALDAGVETEELVPIKILDAIRS